MNKDLCDVKHSYDSQLHNAAVGVLLVVSVFFAVGNGVTAGLGGAEGSFHQQPSQLHQPLLQTPP